MGTGFLFSGGGNEIILAGSSVYILAETVLLLLIAINEEYKDETLFYILYNQGNVRIYNKCLVGGMA